ncbi:MULTISPECIES: hypothetical protein [unclassified Streptomyces]|uniref:hypothetical protein n=1 Tax=unclassified Streptomyces TaxID=2593676 RepID=UPI0034471A26
MSPSVSITSAPWPEPACLWSLLAVIVFVVLVVRPIPVASPGCGVTLRPVSKTFRRLMR